MQPSSQTQSSNAQCSITAFQKQQTGKQNGYTVLAYYHLTALDDPQNEVCEHKKFLQTLDVKARIYLSNQGINGQMSIAQDQAKTYMDWLSSKPAFCGVEFKLQPCSEHVFPRLTIKVRKELVALGQEVSMDERGEYLSPKEWRCALESEDDKIVLDVRNDYEWKVGHFEGAELFSCQTFKDFTHSVVELKKKIDAKKTKVLMYCTGGIRCELFSALLKQEGIDQVYQLHGGVIRYGEEEKTKHWLGKLFVFDDRLAVNVSADESAQVIGKCHHCQTATESYYNCANMDCNELFLCCPDCAARVRPYEFAHKPFRRWYHYAKTKKGE